MKQGQKFKLSAPETKKRDKKYGEKQRQKKININGVEIQDDEFIDYELCCEEQIDSVVF